MTRTPVAAGDYPDDRELIGTADAARILGVTPRRLYLLIDEGAIAAYRFGRVIRIRRGDVLRLRGTLGDAGPEWP